VSDELDLVVVFDRILERRGIPRTEWLGDFDRAELVDELLEATRAHAAPARRPPWEKVRAAAGHLSTLVTARGARAIAELDQLRGTIRDELDELEVSVRDEFALYHGLVWTGLVVELARNGLRNEALDVATYEAISDLATTIASALLDYLPPEARP
jgi:hypothetical protein